MARVGEPALRSLVAAMLRAVGTPASHVEGAAEALVNADMEGVGSHGVMLLPMYLDRVRAGSVDPTALPATVIDAGGLLILSARDGLGQVSSQVAVAEAVARARRHGVACVAVRDGFHFGAASYWTRMLATEGMIGLALCNTRPLMPPPGGAERVVGNNPLSIAFPSAAGAPIVVDMAMSATAMGKIRLADAAGKPIPEGWATAAQGDATTSAAEAIAGMLLPAAGPKGFGLAVAIDLLSGALSGGAVGGQVTPLYGDVAVPYRCAHTFIAIDAAQSGADVGAVADGFADTIRGGARSAGTDRLFAPGDIERSARDRNGDACTIADALLNELNERASALGIAERLVAAS